MRILLLEDDPVLGEVIATYLSDDYDVSHVYDASEAQEHIQQQRFDLFVFDINLPGESGIALLHSLREFAQHTPAIMITAYRSVEYLKKSFEAGAHDVLHKPFELEELRLRIERSKRMFHLDEEEVRIDASVSFFPKRNYILKEGQKISLKPKEAEMLRYFLTHPGRMITYEELCSNLWEYETMPETATLRSYIRSLRAMIGAERIVTERGQGWRYEPA